METVYAPNGVVYLKSGLIPCTHGFATRVGGISRVRHTASLNLAFGRGDNEATVLQNLELFGKAAGFDPQSVISLRQVHSSCVRTVTASDRGLGYYIQSDFCCDGYVTDDPRVTLGVKTADCVPVLLCALDSGGRPFVVAAIHAGWRGTLAKIAENGVGAMIRLGVRPEQIFAAIGPAIGQCCFEIDASLKDEFSLNLERRSARIYPPSERSPKVARRPEEAECQPASRLRCPRRQHRHLMRLHLLQPRLFYSHRRDRETRDHAIGDKPDDLRYNERAWTS